MPLDRADIIDAVLKSLDPKGHGMTPEELDRLIRFLEMLQRELNLPRASIRITDVRVIVSGVLIILGAVRHRLRRNGAFSTPPRSEQDHE
jgi:hypothetical protein